MPVALTCTCGRSMRVKDEIAGKKIRCPACSTVLLVPRRDTPTDDEEEAGNLLLEEPEEPRSDDNRDTADVAPATDAIQPPPRPGPRPYSPPEPPRPEWKWRKKKPPPAPLRKRKPGLLGKVFNNVNPNYGIMWTGIFMVLGSVGLALVNGLILLQTGYISPCLIAVTVILFFSSIGTFFKGVMGRNN